LFSTVTLGFKGGGSAPALFYGLPGMIRPIQTPPADPATALRKNGGIWQEIYPRIA